MTQNKNTDRPVVAGVVRNRRLSDQIYDLLLEQIRTCTYSLEDLITEPAIAKALSTSRTPVREALFRLASNGVLTERGRGYRLPVLSRSDVTKLFSVRTMIELEIIRLLGELPWARELDDLRKFAGRERDAVNVDGAEKFVAANNAFREALFSYCDNRYLVEIADMANDRMQAYRFMTLAKRKNRQVVADAHASVIVCLGENDTDGAIIAYQAMMDSAVAAYADYSESD